MMRFLSSKDAPDLTEPRKPTYRYPLGMGQFLLSGCYDFLVNSKESSLTSGFSSSSFMKSPSSESDDELESQPLAGSSSFDDDDSESESASERRKRRRRRRRHVGKIIATNKTDFRSFCRRFAQLQKNIECRVNYECWLSWIEMNL